MVTRYGVCYDLNVSPYKFRVGNITYVFSSELYKSNFKEKFQTHREEMNNKLTKRYDIPVIINTLCDIVLYKKVEKRGFLLLVDGVGKVCKGSLILNGEIMTFKNSTE
jgi:hypothetical protein